MSSDLIDQIQELTTAESKLVHEIIPHLKKSFSGRCLRSSLHRINQFI